MLAYKANLPVSLKNTNQHINVSVQCQLISSVIDKYVHIE